MNELPERYEKPTDELRQVHHHPFGHFYFTVQRKWLVQDGEVHFRDKEPPPFLFPFSEFAYLDNHCNTWVALKEEWRDLPIVESGD